MSCAKTNCPFNRNELLETTNCHGNCGKIFHNICLGFSRSRASYASNEVIVLCPNCKTVCFGLNDESSSLIPLRGEIVDMCCKVSELANDIASIKKVVTDSRANYNLLTDKVDEFFIALDDVRKSNESSTINVLNRLTMLNNNVKLLESLPDAFNSIDDYLQSIKLKSSTDANKVYCDRKTIHGISDDLTFIRETVSETSTTVTSLKADVHKNSNSSLTGTKSKQTCSGSNQIDPVVVNLSESIINEKSILDEMFEEELNKTKVDFVDSVVPNVEVHNSFAILGEINPDSQNINVIVSADRNKYKRNKSRRKNNFKVKQSNRNKKNWNDNWSFHGESQVPFEQMVQVPFHYFQNTLNPLHSNSFSSDFKQSSEKLVNNYAIRGAVSKRSNHNYKWLHISNLSLEANETNLRGYLLEKFRREDIECVQLDPKQKLRYPKTYKCFKIKVPICLVEAMKDTRNWDKGIVVKDFQFSKGGFHKQRRGTGKF